MAGLVITERRRNVLWEHVITCRATPPRSQPGAFAHRLNRYSIGLSLRQPPIRISFRFAAISMDSFILDRFAVRRVGLLLSKELLVRPPFAALDLPFCTIIDANFGQSVSPVLPKGGRKLRPCFLCLATSCDFRLS